MIKLRAIACLIITIGFFACDEVGPSIDFGPPPSFDTTYVVTNVPNAQDRVVLIEEFSGVQCSNCPNGAAKVEEIISNHPNRIAAVTLHAGFFAVPYESSTEDFEIEETIEINDWLAIPAYPSAVFDRFKFDGTPIAPVLQTDQWPIRVDTRLDAPTIVNIETSINQIIDIDNSFLRGSATVTFTDSYNENAFLALYLTEDDIIDLQLMPDNTINETYKHKHVARDMFTPWNGVLLDNGGNYEAGRTFVKEFDLPIDENWDLDKLYIVALVFQNAETTKEVLQAATEKLEL